MSDPLVAKVLLLRKNIERALESDASAEEVGDIVTALSEVEMSIEMLRTTKIGVTIAAVRKKFPDEEVGTAAKEMIGKWKVLVPAKSPSNASIASAGSTGSTGTGDVASKIITLGAPPKAPETDPSQQTDLQDSSASDDPRYAVLPPARKKVRRIRRGVSHVSEFTLAPFSSSHPHAASPPRGADRGPVCREAQAERQRGSQRVGRRRVHGVHH